MTLLRETLNPKIWVMPWHRGGEQIWVKVCALKNKQSGIVKGKNTESKILSDYKKFDNILMESEAVELPPKWYPKLYELEGSVSWIPGEEKAAVIVADYPLAERIKWATEDSIWRFQVLWDKLVTAYLKRKYEADLNINWEPVRQEVHKNPKLVNLWRTYCPKCLRQIILEEGNFPVDPDDPYDSNKTIFIEGQEMRSHSHPISNEDIWCKAQELLLAHLVECDKQHNTGTIPLEGELGSDGWQSPPLRVSRSRKTGAAAASCLLCQTVYKTEPWGLLTDVYQWYENHKTGCLPKTNMKI